MICWSGERKLFSFILSSPLTFFRPSFEECFLKQTKQTDLVKDFLFPRVYCFCNVQCPVLSEGIIKCCLDCIKYESFCHSYCEKLTTSKMGNFSTP
jgi:hypothetical protein